MTIRVCTVWVGNNTRADVVGCLRTDPWTSLCWLPHGLTTVGRAHQVHVKHKPSYKGPYQAQKTRRTPLAVSPQQSRRGSAKKIENMKNNRNPWMESGVETEPHGCFFLVKHARRGSAELDSGHARLGPWSPPRQAPR